MRGAVPLLLLGAAALLASCAAQDLGNCDLGDPEGLSSCIKQLLIDARPKIAEEADPLSVPDVQEGDFELKNILVHGISGFNIPSLSVTFPGEQDIAVNATIAWTHLYAKMDAKYRKCKRILWKKRCATVRARPEVFVEETEGSLATTMNVHVSPDGQITVTASGTEVKLDFAKIRVEAHLRGVTGWFNRLVGDPASSYITKKARENWGKKRGEIETKAKEALDKAIREKVAVQLGRLLKL